MKLEGLLWQLDLEPALAGRVLTRYASGFYDDAASTAFKVVEVRMRELAGPEDGTPSQVINSAWHASTGKLHDPALRQPEREALNSLFRGAFGYFRNPLTHRFVDLSPEESFDLIVLANRLLKIVEGSAGRVASSTPTSEETSPTGSIGKEHMALNEIGSRQFLLDLTSDGIPDLVIIPKVGSLSDLRVIDGATGERVYFDSATTPMPMLESISLEDVDGDGKPELVVSGGWDTATGIVIFRYEDGRLKLLTKALETWVDWNGTTSDYIGTFVDGYVTDFDNDGKMEVVEVPYIGVPEDLVPDEFGNQGHGWGRVRYIWKWNQARQAFENVDRALDSMGGR